jgi:hypothetical protein
VGVLLAKHLSPMGTGVAWRLVMTGVRAVRPGVSAWNDWTTFRRFAAEQVSMTNGDDVENPTGEWVGTESNRARGERNDALVALASFVFGTITPGCGCEECDARRETVMTLIYGKSVDAGAIDDAIQPVPK